MIQTAEKIVIRAVAANLPDYNQAKKGVDYLICSEEDFAFFTLRPGGKAAFDWTLILQDVAQLASFARTLYALNKLLLPEGSKEDKRVGLIIQVVGATDLWVNGMGCEDIFSYLVDAYSLIKNGKVDLTEIDQEICRVEDPDKWDRKK